MSKELEIKLQSKRGTEINCSLVVADTDKKAPLVICVHGFKADRTEGGRFTTVGKALAETGVHSICMQFAGCHDSKEDFVNYCLDTCMEDIDTCYEYMLNTYDIDKEHLGMIGYSMGGRITSVYTNKHPEFRVIGLWAAAAYNGFPNDEFQGYKVSEMVKVAEEKGYCEVLNSFDNQPMKLSKRFFDNAFEYHPEECLKEYEGCAIVCHGTKDVTVLPEVAEQTMNNLVKAKKKKLVMIEGANHGFGLWDDHMEQSKILTDSTIEFFKENL